MRPEKSRGDADRLRAGAPMGRRGSADHTAGAIPFNHPSRLLGPALRAVSTDLVREEASSNDPTTMKQLNILSPAMPKGTNGSLSFQVGDYAVHHLLGKGGSGQVYMGSHVKTGQVVAIKMVDRKSFAQEGEERLMRDCTQEDMRDGIAEFKILSLCDHKHIVKLLHAEENERRISMVLEYAAQGDLFTHIRTQATARPRSSSLSLSSPTKRISAAVGIPRSGSAGSALVPGSSKSRKRSSLIGHACCYPENEAKRLFRQLLSAVHYIHLRGYIHRDIKPENILIDRNDNAVLCDFSLATTWNPTLTRSGSCGTLHFAAPEVLTEGKYVGPEVDIWSCGAVLYFMLSGEKPFQAIDDFEVLRNIKKGKKKSLDKKRVSKAARNLVDRMLEGNPLKRITMMDILNHEWFKNPSLTSPTKPKKKKSMFDKEEALSRSLDNLPCQSRSQSSDSIVVAPPTSLGSPSSKKRSSTKSKNLNPRSALFIIEE